MTEARCPKCRARLDTINVEPLRARPGSFGLRKPFLISCSKCHEFLAVEVASGALQRITGRAFCDIHIVRSRELAQYELPILASKRPPKALESF